MLSSRIDVDFFVLITLTLDAPFALFQIAGTPGTIQIVQGNQSILHVGSGSHFGGAAHQDAYFSFPDFAEQRFLFHF